MKLILAISAVIITGFTSVIAAEDLSYIHAGKLIDVISDKVLSDQLITVKGDRIVAVSDWSDTPANAHIIDWSDYTVMPGLIDGHSHLIGDIQSDDVAAPLDYTREEDIAIGVTNAKKTIDAGFTSVIDMGAYRGYTDVALRNMINRGDVPGPRMWVSGAYVTVTGGGGEVYGSGMGGEIPAEFRTGVADNEEEVRARVNDLLAGDVDLIKMITTGAVLTVGTDPGEPEYNEAEIRAAVEEAAKQGKFVAAHAHGAEGVKMAVRAGVRTIQHGSLMDDESLALMKAKGTWLVADIYNGDYINEVGAAENWPEETMRKNRETTGTQRAVFRKAVALGINIAFGTDSGVYPHGTNGKQFAYMVRYGLTPMQAIKSATIWGAQSMALEADIGSISPGKLADMIAVKGDVLNNIRLLEHVDGVIKDGKLVN
ncbi:MAG: imidazolonepropionase-like amidohydrolase [Halieaceae bacterium]|jgi:imidazolonepropionase-like amidohydrolase